MYINYERNNNSKSLAFGKFYAKVDQSETLTNEGLVNHIIHHNCAVGREAIAAVIKKLSECIPELVAQGQPVKIEGLGTFYPTATSDGMSDAQLLDKQFDPTSRIKGIHLRFRPQSDSLNDLTSKSFLKAQVTPLSNLVTKRVEEVIDGKRVVKWKRATLAEYRNYGGFPEDYTPNP